MTKAVVSPALASGQHCCPNCGGKLTTFSGFRKNLDNLSAVPVRLYWIACQACQTPAAPHHPLQLKLDGEMASALTRTAGNVEVLKRLTALETEVAMLKMAIQKTRKR